MGSEHATTTSSIVATGRDPRTARRAFWLTFVGVFLAVGAWSIANPVMAAPDEPAHAVKAAATVRGEFFADESHYNPGRGDFAVPRLFHDVWNVPCFAYQPQTPASCFTGFSGDLAAPSTSTSHVDRYNPLYYAVIGLPSLFGSSPATLYAMRLVGAALNGLLIAMAARTVAELRSFRWPLAGLVAAVTPMTVFIFSSMTPQGVEIAGAIVTWLVLLALTREPDPTLLSRRMWRLVVGSGLFVLTRGLSPAYLAIVLLVVWLAAPDRGQVWHLVRARGARLPIGICAGVTAAAAVYTLASGSLALGVVLPDPTLTARAVVRVMVGNTSAYIEQLIGVFGWGDTHLPLWMLMCAGGVLLAVLLVGLARAARRERWAVLLTAALTFVVPIAVQLESFHTTGIVWQGKYILPVAVGLPLLAGFLAERAEIPPATSAALVRGLAALAGVVQVGAFTVNLHRYVVGAGGAWFGASSWSPPGGAVLLTGVLVVVATAAVVAVWRFTAVPRPAGDSEHDPEGAQQ